MDFSLLSERFGSCSGGQTSIESCFSFVVQVLHSIVCNKCVRLDLKVKESPSDEKSRSEKSAPPAQILEPQVRFSLHVSFI